MLTLAADGHPSRLVYLTSSLQLCQFPPGDRRFDGVSSGVRRCARQHARQAGSVDDGRATRWPLHAASGLPLFDRSPTWSTACSCVWLDTSRCRMTNSSSVSGTSGRTRSRAHAHLCTRPSERRDSFCRWTAVRIHGRFHLGHDRSARKAEYLIVYEFSAVENLSLKISTSVARQELRSATWIRFLSPTSSS